MNPTLEIFYLNVVAPSRFHSPLQQRQIRRPRVRT